MSATDPKLTPKPKRSYMTKAERDAARAAKADAEMRAANKPLDPRIWMLVGGVLLLLALWTWLDPVTYAEAGQPQSVFEVIPSLLIYAFTKTPIVLILTVVGAIPFLSGLIGWLRGRFSAPVEKP